MSNMRSSAVHDNRVESVESEYGDEVARLNQVLVVVYLLDIALLDFPIHDIRQKFNVGIDHVVWHMRSDYGQHTVLAQAANEAL